MMKKLLVYICTLIVAFMFISCQTSYKATPETSEKSLVQESINLTGLWNVAGKWKNEVDGGTFNIQNEIVQKGMEITLRNLPNGSEHYGTLKGNIVHMEVSGFVDPKGYNISLPTREIHISQDQNTLTMEYQYTWEGRNNTGFGIMTITMTRE